MSTGPGVNLGKTAFVKDYLTEHRDANVDAVKEAWTAAKHEGTISESLVNKMRQKLGLTGGRGRSESESSEKTGRKSEASAPGRKASHTAAPVGRPPRESHQKAVGAKGHLPHQQADEDDILDELEEGIDELIQKIREMGDKPDVVRALRRARRMLGQNH